MPRNMSLLIKSLLIIIESHEPASGIRLRFSAARHRETPQEALRSGRGGAGAESRAVAGARAPPSPRGDQSEWAGRDTRDQGRDAGPTGRSVGGRRLGR